MTTPPPQPSWAGPSIDMTALQPARAVSWATGQAQQLLSVPALVLGWSVLEASGAAVTSGWIIDGGDNNGQIIGQWGVGAGLADTVPIPPPGILAKDGIWIYLHAGGADVTVWYVPLDPRV